MSVAATLEVNSATRSLIEVTQGKSRFAHAAMLYTGKALALAAIRLMENPELLAEARKEHFEKTGGKYVSAMPPDLKPHI